jgi:hypothetical protein
MASSRVSIPASCIQPATQSLARRIAGEQKVRVSLPGSSLIEPSVSIRSITPAASSRFT